MAIESEMSDVATGYSDDVLYPVKMIRCTDGTRVDNVKITWNPVNYAEKYKILRCESGNMESMITPTLVVDNIDSSATEYVDTAATPGVIYLYYVYAKSSRLGESPMPMPDRGYCGFAKGGMRLGRFVVDNMNNSNIYNFEIR